MNLYLALRNKNKKDVLNQEEIFISYLRSIHGRELQKNGILKRVLQVNWDEKDITYRNKAFLQSALNYFRFLFTKIKTEPNDRIYQQFVTAIFDLIPVLQQVDSNINLSFYGGNTNVQESFIQFKRLEQLFYDELIANDASHYDIGHIILPYLRTILESRIKGVLGIDFVRDQNNKNIELSEILKILAKVKRIKLDKAFDISMIKLIINWANHYMHRNMRPDVYIVHSVISYLTAIFHPAKVEIGSKTIFSVYASSSVHSLDELKIEVESIIRQKYPDSSIGWRRHEVVS